MGTIPSWHALGPAEVLRRLGSGPREGLCEEEAERRLASHGPNELPRRAGRSALSILASQFLTVMAAVLALAGAFSALLGEWRDAAAILAILLLNALLGFRQEFRAERAMEALARVAAPTARVRRGGRLREIPSRLLVPGDIFLLEPGSQVPADGRVVEAASLRTQEASLTGESTPVEKDPAPVPQERPVSDRHGMVYLGTFVAYGRGTAVVTSTGPGTELGRIAGMIRSIEREATPLQRRMAQLARALALVALALVGIVVLLGSLRGEPLPVLLLTAVSMAVAAVPEGLPAVVTISLALGAQRMLRRNALIRKLPAVETLGQVTVICSDKTGTLTRNRMRVVALASPDGTVDLPASGAEPGGVEPAQELLLAGFALCTDAEMGRAGEGGEEEAVGDPTECALVESARRLGVSKKALEEEFPRVGEAPFDSERKRMTTVHRLGAASRPFPGFPETEGTGAERRLLLTKGAPDAVLAACASVRREGAEQPLADPVRRRILAENERLAGKGLRVLALAYRIAEPPVPGGAERMERDLVFGGLAGMLDPPRAEVPQAVATCSGAGIRPLLITGDHPRTAIEVARLVGVTSEGRALTGAEIGRLGPGELGEALSRHTVCARVSPEHKLRIVEALKERGHVVAMTGDGVNDAPALRRADIGVAMGIVGTDVAKEAADMVLLDDNFATIVAAVEEGRAIYDNVRKFLRYLLLSNFGEILVMIAGPSWECPFPCSLSRSCGSTW